MFYLGNNHSSRANFVYKGILQPCKEKSVVSRSFELKAGIKKIGEDEYPEVTSVSSILLTI